MTYRKFGTGEHAISGEIVMWAGLLTDIPNGWVICDGNNGTPNLLDRFPKMVPDTVTDPGTTGGANSLTLATSQLPSHSHSGSTDYAGYHNHQIDYSQRQSNSSVYGTIGGSNSTGTTDSGNHSHSLYVDNSGGGASVDNRPEHFEVAYIMKA